MNNQIVRFFECLIPITICNLKCNYCYVIQRNYRNMKKADLKYTPEQIGKCLTKDRLGGICYFSICGAGETMAQPEIIDIIHNILKQGHIVNITTNGTLSNVFKKLSSLDSEELKRLHFSFSFHYLELIRTNSLERFFDNVLFVKKLGCSFIVQLNLCDEYIPHLDDIKKVCLEKIGAVPQIAATRKEENKELDKISLHTDLSFEEYLKIGETFDSKLFSYTMGKFNEKRKEFCYAGDRSGVLNLATGELKKCYGDPCGQNIFKNPNSKIKFEPVGKNCYSCFCMNSSHFISQGVIDGLDEDISYYSIRDREDAKWFNDTVKEALSHKLIGSNKRYSSFELTRINIKEKMKKGLINAKKAIKKVVKRKKCQREPKI